MLVSHLDPSHVSHLTQILSRTSAVPVSEVADHPAVLPNHAYVIPPDKYMTVAGGHLRLAPREASGPHKSIDIFFRSLAEDYKHLAIGVVLSGTGTDGTQGLAAIKAEGGITFAQNETAEYESMPGSAIGAGLADFVLSPEGIAQELTSISQHPLVAPERAPASAVERDERALANVLEQMRSRTGIDFSDYRHNTLYRRIARRMVLHRNQSLDEYAQLLQKSPSEMDALFQDILISVTSFFRNPETFESLKKQVFPQLLEEHGPSDAVRMWTTGCSTGEEAYSLAMAWTEFADSLRKHVPLQIYATDLNGAGVDKARTGLYSKAITQDVSPERLRRFFVDTDGGYRIAKPIRDSVVFARHNVISDPPFSRIDLVSCRNLLIYLDPVLQQRIVRVLHYALRPRGYLFLGTSETVGSFRGLFDVVDGKHKIFSKKISAVRTPIPVGPRQALGAEPWRRSERPAEGQGAAAEPLREAERLLLSRYVPTSVVVNSDFDVLQFRGDTGRYLTPGTGRASLNLLKMAREGLLMPLRTALHRARRDDTTVREENVAVKGNGAVHRIQLEVLPLRANADVERTFLVLFLETRSEDSRELHPTSAVTTSSADEEAEPEVLRLSQELTATREYLQSVIEQQEAVNEELQSANEEVQSANEELQSINEELETTKEEIQSSNEELMTVNEEMQNRNQDLAQLNDDLRNLLSSVQTAIVFVGRDLRIRRFTPVAERLLNLTAADIGRPISDISLRVEVDDLRGLLGEVIDSVTSREMEVRSREGTWYQLRVRPYQTADNVIDGAVLMLNDIDAMKRTENVLRRHAELLDAAHEAIFVWDLDGGITYWNHGAEEVYGYSAQQAEGRKPAELLGTKIDYSILRETLLREGQWRGELEQYRLDGERVLVESRMSLSETPEGGRIVLETNHLITERKELELTLRRRTDELMQADRRKNEFLAMLAHELRNPLASLRNASEILQLQRPDADATPQAIRIIERQLRNITRMTDDLLDIARVNQDKIRLRGEPVDLSQLVRAAVEEQRSALESRGLALDLRLSEGSTWIQGDAVRLDQVIANLLDNAAKYTGEGGHIWVTLDREPASKREPRFESAVLRVRDDGIGMAPEMLLRVFDLFCQADATRGRRYGGLGIGLTLVRRLVEMHGGSAEVESPGPNQGTTFTVRLPILSVPFDEDEPRAPVTEPPERKAEPRRVLLIDDNVDAADSLATLLRIAGHTVHVAYDGPAALVAASRVMPEVILLDIGMPGMDGFEVARRLRELPGPDGAMIVALTGYSQEDDRKNAVLSGFDLHLTKPVNFAVVQDVLRQHKRRS